MEDNEKADISRFCAEQAILENLKPGEYYEPAFRIINHSGQKADLSVCGIVNGKSYQWARVSVPDNESYLSYARTKERSLLASSDIAAFDCMLYVNAVPCMSGVIEIQTDSTAAENTIVFGSYEQDGDPNNGPEGIEWLVLDEHDGKRLLVSRYALAREQMIEKAGTYHWEDSSLRIWLNQVFYETAFIESERAQILLSTIDNKSCENTPFGNTGGTFITTLMDLNQRKDDPDTQDHVFLLSYEELVSFFPEEGSRRCRTSALFGSEACEWWLRSPNLKNSAVITVAVTGNTKDNSGIGSVYVRPALWITG